MGSVVWAGFLAFFVASLSVGVRLLLLWRRTRQLPELLIGIGVLGIGPVGFGAMMIGYGLVHSGVVNGDSVAGRLPFAVAYGMIYAGVFSKYVFNWRVYHPDRKPVLGLVVSAGVVLSGLFLYNGLVRGFAPAPDLDPPMLLQNSVQSAALLWGSIEALRYWRMMRRRSALGLADPVVTNRFLLWGIGAGAAGVGTTIGAIASFATGVASLEIPWVVASSSAHGLVAAIAMWLAFLPPKSYLRFVARQESGA